MSKVSVTFSLNDITVDVEKKDGITDKEILELAKKEVIKKLERKFPSFSYSISEGNVLTFENANIGVVIEHKDHGYGIVIKVNKKTVNVAFKKGVLTGHPAAFNKADNVNVKEIMWERTKGQQEQGWWSEGDTGFLSANNKIIPIVIGSSSRGKTKAIIINEPGKSYSLTDAQIKALVFDKEKDAKLVAK